MLFITRKYNTLLVFPGRLTSSPSVFTADEYRAWMSRTPSSSAIFDRIRGSTSTASSMLRQKGQRFTFSAENIPERTRQSELLYNYRPGHLSAIATLDRHGDRSTSLKRIKHLLELEQKHLANATRERDMTQDRARVLEINPAGRYSIILIIYYPTLYNFIFVDR